MSAGTSVYRCNDVVALASTDAHESHAPRRRVVETAPDEYLHLLQPGAQRISLIGVTTMPLNPVLMLHFANRNWLTQAGCRRFGWRSRTRRLGAGRGVPRRQPMGFRGDRPSSNASDNTQDCKRSDPLGHGASASDHLRENERRIDPGEFATRPSRSLSA